MVSVLAFAKTTNANAMLFADSLGSEPHLDWATYVGTHTEVDIPGEELSPLTALTLPYGETLTFSRQLEVRQVPSTWKTWSEGHTPTVLYTGSGIYSFSGTFSSPVSAFGLEMEPNPFAWYDMSLRLTDGTMLTQSVDGQAGAKFFGWADEAVTSMTISSLSYYTDPVDFAIGRMVQGQTTVPVPEPATLSFLGLGLLGLVGLKKNTKLKGKKQ